MRNRELAALLTSAALLVSSSTLPVAAFEDYQYEESEHCTNDTFNYIRYESHIITIVDVIKLNRNLMIGDICLIMRKRQQI